MNRVEDEERPFTCCPDRGEKVSPDDPNVTYAVEQRRLTAMGPTHTIVDGMGGYFHPGCSPAAVGYAQRPRP
jgi:hypothetical protein